MGKIIWFTGLSGSGKTTIAEELKKKLEKKGNTVEILDGDVLRETLHKNLGFSREDIRENNILIAILSKEKSKDFDFVLVPIISPYKEDRRLARSILGEDFVELFINTSLQECINRDVKGLYKKAISGEINNFIGISNSNPYEIPENPDIEISTKDKSINENVLEIVNFLCFFQKPNFSKDFFSKDTRLAIDAVLEAGKSCLEIYKTNFNVMTKEDKSPLTEADIKSNTILHQFLLKSNYPILSEESDDNELRLQQSKVWIIDPIDGTSDFVNKTGQFSIMVGLVENNLAIAGIVFQPTLGDLFVAEVGKGCYMRHNDKWVRLKVTNQDNIKYSRAIGSRHHLENHEKNFLNKIGVSSFRQHGSAGLKVAEICKGTAELYFTTTNKIKHWDTCAAYSLIKEAGGMITDMIGNEFKYNLKNVNHENGILVSNGKLHPTILKEFEDFLKIK